MHYVGGPPPGADRPIPGTVSISPGPNHPDVATLQTDRNGRFHASVRPGTYLVIGASPRLSDPMMRTVKVEAGRTSSVDFVLYTY
jgi:hypothetical protein